MPPKQIPSDIYLIAEQKPHPIFIRAGSDLIMQLELSFCKSILIQYNQITLYIIAEYLTGCTKYVKHLKEGIDKSFKILKIKIPPLKNKLIIIGKGMPKTQLNSLGKF